MLDKYVGQISWTKSQPYLPEHANMITWAVGQMDRKMLHGMAYSSDTQSCGMCQLERGYQINKKKRLNNISLKK